MNFTRSSLNPRAGMYRLLVVTLAVLFLAGCASRSRYVAFTDSGIAFNTAMLQLGADAQRAVIDQQSERLLARMHGRGASARAERLSSANARAADRSGALAQLNETTRLMKDYFSALKKLASTEAPGQIQSEVSTAGDNLAKFVEASGSGDGAEITAGAGTVSTVTGAVAGLAVDTALERELKARAAVLEAAFALQEQLLDKVAEEMQKDIEDAAIERAERLVTRPYVGGRLGSAGAQNAWMEERAKALLVGRKIAVIADARSAMKQMRENFTKLLSGKITAADLDAFTTQIAGLMGLLKLV